MQAQRRRANQATMRPGALTPGLYQTDTAKTQNQSPFKRIAPRGKKQTIGHITSTPPLYYKKKTTQQNAKNKIFFLFIF
ncbi:hypothetical protein ACVGW0_00665 [Enterobacter intestinihominis]